MYLDIKSLRVKNNLSQKRLAQKAHISQSELSYLERNVPKSIKGVRLGIIEDIAKALNVPVSRILRLD